MPMQIGILLFYLKKLEPKIGCVKYFFGLWGQKHNNSLNNDLYHFI